MTLYLLHFSRPYHHARHYLGVTDNLDERLREHASGNGARLMEVVSQAGITFELVRTWQGDRHLERRMKKHNHSPRFCPLCNPKGYAARTKRILSKSSLSKSIQHDDELPF